MAGGGRLPTLARRDAIAMFRHFDPDCTVIGDVVAGAGRHGTFTVHLNHGGGLRPDTLQRALGYLGVTRAQFFEWRRGK